LDWKSGSVYFSPLEWLALIAAIGISIWCMAKPLGGPKYELLASNHLLAGRGFSIEGPATGDSFTARRT
jgi:hypothetical protein